MGNIYSTNNPESKQSDNEKIDCIECVVEDDFVAVAKLKPNCDIVEVKLPLPETEKLKATKPILEVFGTTTDYPSKAPFFGADVSKVTRIGGEPTRVLFPLEAIRLGLRQKIYSFILRNQLPYIPDIISLANDEECSFYKESTIMNYIDGVNFCRIDISGPLKENEEMANWRRQYLRDIRNFRKEGRPIYYVGQTLINTVIRGVEIEKRNPSVTILLIGSENGLARNGSFLIENTENVDYASTFKIWFADVLTYLEPDSVIVVDYACWRSNMSDDPPSMLSTRNEMQVWLRQDNIRFEYDLTNSELVKLTCKDRPFNSPRIVDELAEKTGRTVLRAPMYHTEFSPIELISTKIKRDILEKAIILQRYNAGIFALEALALITPAHWSAAVKRVIGEEETAVKLDMVMEELVKCYNRRSYFYKHVQMFD